MRSIRTTDVVPSDLNAFIGLMEMHIKQLAERYDRRDVAIRMQ